MTNSPLAPALALLLLLSACLPVFDRPGGDPPPKDLADLGGGVPPWSEVTGDPTAPPGSGGSTSGPSGPATSSGAETSGAASAASAAETPASLRGLRLTEVLADPPGKDGGAGSPEYLEILHTGDEVAPLAAIEVLARAWPTMDAAALGLADEHLAPGERLLIRRFASEDEADHLGVTREGSIVTATFDASGGLRNDDGAVMLRGIDGTILDALIYGGPAPSPYDSPAAWEGAAVDAPAAGEALCRIDPAADHDDASDWIACAPSPGEVDPPTSTTGEDTTTTEWEASSTDPTDTGGGSPPNLVIVEVFSNPPGPSAEERALEYVEIINVGGAPADLEGFTIADDLADDAPGRDPLLYREGDGGCGPLACLAPGQRALIVGNLYTGPTGGALVLETDDTTIADGGLSAAEPVVLRDAADLVLSTYRAWDDPTSEPYPLAVESPLQRLSPEAVDAPSGWVYAEPTPGLP